MGVRLICGSVTKNGALASKLPTLTTKMTFSNGALSNMVTVRFSGSFPFSSVTNGIGLITLVDNRSKFSTPSANFSNSASGSMAKTTPAVLGGNSLPLTVTLAPGGPHIGQRVIDCKRGGSATHSTPRTNIFIPSSVQSGTLVHICGPNEARRR